MNYSPRTRFQRCLLIVCRGELYACFAGLCIIGTHLIGFVNATIHVAARTQKNHRNQYRCSRCSGFFSNSHSIFRKKANRGKIALTCNIGGSSSNVKRLKSAISASSPSSGDSKLTTLETSMFLSAGLHGTTTAGGVCHPKFGLAPKTA